MPTATAVRFQTLPSGVLYGLVAALIWGAWPVLSRLGVQQSLTAYDVTALRFGVAGLALLPVVWWRGTAGLGWGRALVLACGAGVPYALVTIGGLGFAPAGHAGVIAPSCMLAVSTLGGWLLLGDRPDRARWIGLTLIVCGVALVGWEGLSGGEQGAWIGDLMCAAGGTLWACYTLASRVWKVEPLHATALVAVLSMVVYLPAYALFGDPGILDAPIAETVFQGVFQGLFAAILALLCFTRAVATLGAARGAVFGALVPAVAVLLAFPVLGEAPGMRELTGVVVVTIGMICALALKRT